MEENLPAVGAVLRWIRAGGLRYSLEASEWYEEVSQVYAEQVTALSFIQNMNSWPRIAAVLMVQKALSASTGPVAFR